MSETYSKLFSSITTSTVWSEDNETRILWITILAMSDQHGYVGGSIPGLAAYARISIEAVERGLEKFLAPDKYSRSQEYEGRLIEVADRVWNILNYDRFRNLRDEEVRRDYERKRKQDQRAKARGVRDSSGLSHDVPRSPALSAQAEAEAEAEESKEGVPDGTLSPARVVELWNEISNGTLPHVRMLTPGRRKHIALRLGADAERQKPEWWTSLFRRVVESAFCRGENNRKWRANLDFVVRSEDQIARILEGQYDGAGAVGGSVRAAPQRRPDGIREIR